jgi:uncharacterized lipoprotein YmbA
MIRRRLAAAVVLSTSLLGCPSSPASHFYTLSAVPATSGAHSASSPVQVAAVHIPPSLDRRQMVSLTSANTVQISETNRWSAPLDEMVRKVLAEDLVARLPAGQLILPGSPAPSGARSLVVTITELGAGPGGDVKLTGSWSLLGADSGALIRERNIAIDAGPATSAEATAAAMSRAIGQLADEIASAL